MNNAIIFGAGNIGRGFLGQLFFESGYSLTLVDVDQVLLEALRQRGGYTIRLVDNDRDEAVWIGPVRVLHSIEDRLEIIEQLCQADIGATAVGARVLPFIAPLVAEGMRRRRASGVNSPINLILCENLKGAATIFRQMVEEKLTSDDLIYTKQHLGLVDTVIGRMVPPPTPEMRTADPGLILVEPYKELPVDRSGFVGKIPAVVGMEASDNFGAFTARKLYIHNCGHAVLAYLGYLKKYEYGWQALLDPSIYAQVRQAVDESKAGIVAHYAALPDWLEAHIQDLLNRFANRKLGDTIFRLGRDPLRKLAPTDRLVGAARLAEEAGLQPRAIARGIAAALRFNPSDDPIAQELQKMIKEQGTGQVLLKTCNINSDEPLAHLVDEEYKKLNS
jgi:mannitol-1-phosphate 5-dehydrogenase